MIAARESIAAFIKAKVASNLSGITTPEMRFSLRSLLQPPEFPNCLNLYFYDDTSLFQGNPAYRELTATLELLVEVNPDNPLDAESKAYTVIHKINEFMGQQSIDKMNYAVTPAVSLGSQIQWRESYPLDWVSAPNMNERYIQKSSFLTFRYFEQKITI